MAPPIVNQVCFMKNNVLIILAASAVLLVSDLSLAYGGGGGVGLTGGQGQYGGETAGRPQSASALSSREKQDLTYVREEEKLARDVYLALYEQWGLTPFGNILSSEQRHMDALLKLLKNYCLPDPAAGLVIGEFANSDLRNMYSTLIEQGAHSDVEALKVGGIIEETDILDLQNAMARNNNTDIDTVYSKLECGSRNHLRAFAGVLKAITGQDYLAQVMAQQDVDAILAAPHEQCGR